MNPADSAAPMQVDGEERAPPPPPSRPAPAPPVVGASPELSARLLKIAAKVWVEAYHQREGLRDIRKAFDRAPLRGSGSAGRSRTAALGVVSDAAALIPANFRLSGGAKRQRVAAAENAKKSN